MLSISTLAQRSGAERRRKVFAATPSRVLAQRGWLALFCVILAVFALMPLVALVLRGFLESQDGRTVLSFDALRTVLSESGYWMATWNTVVISIGAMMLATVIGVVLAWCLVRTNVPFARTL